MHLRGPDNQSTYFKENLALAHARLSIIDPSEIADQPMWSDDGRFVILFNGEIYNFR